MIAGQGSVMPSPKQSLRKLIFASLAISLCFVSAAFAQETQTEEKPQPPKIIRKSGGALQGSATRRVEPAYPPLAKAAQISGSVVVEVTIDEEGNVISARAISGHPLLEDAAVAAARGWTFKPTQLQGVPVKVIGTITFNFTMGDHAKEIQGLKEQIANSPNSSELFYKLGQSYSRDSEYENAIDALKRAIEIRPDFPEAYSELGSVYYALRRDEDALAALQRAVSIDPKMDGVESAYLMIGRICFRQGRTQEAIDNLKQVIIITQDSGSSESDDAHFELAAAYVKTGDKRSALKEYKILRKREWIAPDALRPLKELIDAMP